MLTEAHIHLPLKSNEGHDLSAKLNEITTYLLDTFGGLSIGLVQGMWRDSNTGKVYTDVCQRVTIAADWNASTDCGDATKASDLIGMAADFASILDQECIYVVLPSGVQFVEPRKVNRKGEA